MDLSADKKSLKNKTQTNVMPTKIDGSTVWFKLILVLCIYVIIFVYIHCTLRRRCSLLPLNPQDSFLLLV